MAYMDQEIKSKIVVAVKPILKKYGVKGSFSVRNYSSIHLKLTSGKIDFGGNNLDVNTYYYREQFSGVGKDFLCEVITAMKSAGGWYNNSDSMTDYSNIAYFIGVHIGSYGNPYEVIK